MPAKTKSKKITKHQGFTVAGLNSINQISEKSNNNNQYNVPIVCPPEQSTISPECLSYSIYFDHSVMVCRNSTFTKGPNTGNTIRKTQLKNISKLNKLSISDEENNNYSIVSAVCGSNYTLYLLISNKTKKPTLAYFNESLKENDGALIFINIKGHAPLSLFGGRKTAAAIDDQGNVIVIISTPEFSAKTISLPNDEKSIYVACLEKVLFILSEKNKVYQYSLTDQESGISEVEELKDERIVSLSGTWNHALAVTEDFRVFGQGSNEFGQLCNDPKEKSFTEFVKISALNDQNIVSAYAGSYHSLFINSDGGVLSCGKNSNGELLLDDTDTDAICEPTETLIQKGATFCIAGCQISCVFCSMNPPQNTPNQIVQDFNIDITQKLMLKSNPELNKDDSELPEPDPNGNYTSIKSKLLKMKAELQAKNQFYDTIQNQNEIIIKKLQDLDQKIELFLKSNKFEDNATSTPKNDEENDYDEEVAKIPKPKKEKPLKNKDSLPKPSKNKINFDDDDDSTEEEEKNQFQNKLLNKKQNKHKTIEEDDYSDDDDYNFYNTNTRVNPILLNKNTDLQNDDDESEEEEKNQKKPKQQNIIEDDDDEEDDDEYSKDMKLNQQLYKNDEDSDDIDFQLPKRSSIKAKDTQNPQKGTKPKKVKLQKNKPVNAKKKPPVTNKNDHNSEDSDYNYNSGTMMSELLAGKKKSDKSKDSINDEVGFQPPKRSSAKTKKVAAPKKKPIVKDDGSDNDGQKKIKTIKTNQSANNASKKKKKITT